VKRLHPSSKYGKNAPFAFVVHHILTAVIETGFILPLTGRLAEANPGSSASNVFALMSMVHPYHPIQPQPRLQFRV
jgi:hypothetical protein